MLKCPVGSYKESISNVWGHLKTDLFSQEDSAVRKNNFKINMIYCADFWVVDFIFQIEEGTIKIYYITTNLNYRLLCAIEIYKYYKMNIYLIYRPGMYVSYV